MTKKGVVVLVKKLLLFMEKFKGVTIAGIVVVVAFAFLLNASFTIQLRYENSALKDEIFELENLILSANQEIEKTKSDIHIHKVATERLGLVKSGEVPIKINVNEPDEEVDGKEEEKNDGDKLEIYMAEWYKSLTDVIKK